MTEIEKRLTEDMKTAMKAKEKIRLETIRLLRAQLKNAQIDRGQPLTEEEIVKQLMQQEDYQSIQALYDISGHHRSTMAMKK